ncbi:MAG: hypothetical protein ACRYF3_10710 [Janthinobacterium lividum]
MVGGLVCVGVAVALRLVGPMAVDRDRWLLVVLAGSAVCALAAWWVLRGPGPQSGAGRRALTLVVLGTILCQLPGLTSKPLSSTDAYRYVWDGRVQLAGVSPYRWAPGDDALARLRDPILFPGLGADDAGGLPTVREFPPDAPGELARLTRDDPRTPINRPRVVTIYPPVAETWFLLVASVTPWSAGTFGLQLGSALLAVLTTWMAGLVLRRQGRDPRWALLFGWAPLTAHEAANGAHVDMLAAALLVGTALVLAVPRPYSWRRRLAAGLLLGGAVSAKLLPTAALPAVAPLRGGQGRQWLVPVVAVLTTLVSYVPYVAGAGTLVFGFLPAYLAQEGFDSGSKYAVLAALHVPSGARTPVALVVLLVIAVLVARRTPSLSMAEGALVLLGSTMLVITPAYPWYLLPVLALAAVARRPEWIVAALPAYVANSVGAQLMEREVLWSAVALVVVGASLARRLRASGPRPAMSR